MTSDRPDLLQASAAIFDVDGTLVDSVDFHAEAWRRAFAAFGFEFDFLDLRQQIGKGGDQLLPVFLDDVTREREGDKIEDCRQELFAREYLNRVRGFPKTADMFRFLIDAGKRIALGSSANASDLLAYKRAAGIVGLTHVETTSDDVERSKPHPDIFLVALERLGLPAHDVVVVGDSPYDMEAGKKAGIRTTALLCGGFAEEALRQAGASEIYRDPAHLLQVLQGHDRSHSKKTDT